MKTNEILIVDDDPDFCEILRDFIEGKGFQVVVANSGDEALAAYERERPDAVLLDVRMAGMDGFDVLRRIKTVDPEAIVIMVTALVDDETGVEALKLGADGCVTKPVDTMFLWDVLTSRLNFPTAL